MKIMGTAVSSGIAIEKAHIIKPFQRTITPYFVDDTSIECDRFLTAIQMISKELTMRRKRYKNNQYQDLIDVQLLLASDPILVEKTLNLVKETRINAEYAYEQIIGEYKLSFKDMDNAYNRERIKDLLDISRRIIHFLTDTVIDDIETLQDPVIIITDKIMPTDVMQMDPSVVKGIICEESGTTSHGIILARNLGIPVLVGIPGIVSTITPFDTLILDGIQQHVVVNPSDNEIVEYRLRKNTYDEKNRKLLDYVNLKTITIDNHKVQLLANINLINDAVVALQSGTEGIGLYRTEYIYYNHTEPPSEEEQYRTYKSILDMMPHLPVIFRTFDLGEDKQVSYIDTSKQRGLRLSLIHQSLLKIQLRALLRASKHGRLSIMFPLVQSVEDLLLAQKVISEAMEELYDEKQRYRSDIPIGMMVELKDVAHHIDKYLPHVDFLSIGTNDLTQDVLDIDRIYHDSSQALHPDILSLIKKIVERAHKQGKTVSICGELASNPIAIPILVGMGLDSLSVQPRNVLEIRKMIRKLDYDNTQEIANHCVKMNTSEEVTNYILNHIKESQKMKKTYTINKEKGLQARPANLLVQAASQFPNDIFIEYNGIELTLKSIMALMSLGVPQKGEISISVDGEDAKDVLHILEQVMNDNNLI